MEPNEQPPLPQKVAYATTFFAVLTAAIVFYAGAQIFTGNLSALQIGLIFLGFAIFWVIWAKLFFPKPPTNDDTDM